MLQFKFSLTALSFGSAAESCGDHLADYAVNNSNPHSPLGTWGMDYGSPI